MLSDEQYKQLMKSVGIPNSNSLLAALHQCAMEATLIERNVLAKREQLLQKQPQIAYEKYEFCRSMKCPYLTPSTTCCIDGCFYTVKRFHHWLKKNNFKIIKDI